MGAARELGHQQGLITADRERLNFDYANAVADVQNRNDQLNSQVEEAHINLSVRESNIAGAGNQVLKLQQQLEAAHAQLREREFNLGRLTGQLQEREARHNAQQPTRDAETAGRDDAPATRHVANGGVSTLPHQTDILMAGGVPSSAARHSSAAYRLPHGNFGRPHFHPFTPLPSRTSPLEAQSPMEEDRSFCAFDVTMWPTRIWNEGASGVVFDLRCAYQCWQQDDEQVKLVFGNLVEWIGVLEGGQDPTDQFINMGMSLLNTFRMQLTIASDPGIRLSKLRTRLYTAAHQTDTYARAAQLLVDRRETQRTSRCQRCHTYGHEASTCNVRSRGNYSQYRGQQKTAEGLPHAAHECWRRQLHSFRHLPPILTGSAPHRRRSIRYFKSPDAIVGKGNGAYPPTTLDCGTTNYRHPRFGPVTQGGRTMWLDKCGRRQRGSRECP
ncbi:helicase-like protein [Trypanosoma cruzi]|nr:helicase-like protein [Trypanosoma cruzi]